MKYYLKSLLLGIDTEEMVLFGYLKNTLMPLTIDEIKVQFPY